MCCRTSPPTATGCSAFLKPWSWAKARDRPRPIDDASSADTGAAFGQDDSEFNIFNTDRQLSALQTAAQMLGELNEKKSLIYFASGMRLNGIDNQAQLHATVDAAIRAGVSFWPIDARGLVAQAPLGDATQGSPGNAGMYTGGAAHGRQRPTSSSRRTRSTRSPATPAARRCSTTTILTAGIVQAQQADLELLHPRLLHHQHGEERQVPAHQDLARRTMLSANLDYRQGYYADKEFANSPTRTRSASLKTR